MITKTNANGFWTEERTEYLKMWWVASTASGIAAHLGTSKGAVIGKARRLGLIDKLQYYRDNGILYQSKRKKKEQKPKAPPRYLGMGDQPPVCEPVGFMDMTKDHCHAPIDIKGPDGLMMYCGEGICKRLVRDGQDWSYVDSSYCAYHYRLFNKVPKQE